MLTKIRAWGNSQGLCIPKRLLKEALLEVNDSVEISVENGTIVIRKSSDSDVRRKHWETLQTIRNAHKNDDADHIIDHRKEYLEYLDERYGL